MNPTDVEILFALAKIESQITNDPGMDLLQQIHQMENYERRLTPEDKRFLNALRIAP